MLLNPSPIAEIYGVIAPDIEKQTLDYPFEFNHNLGDDFTDVNNLMTSIRYWLVENISAPKQRWDIGNINIDTNTVEYLFKLEEDVMAFKLRWL